jgi:hypothetical protein
MFIRPGFSEKNITEVFKLLKEAAEKNIIEVFKLLEEAAENEFIENNIITVDEFLMQCFKKSLKIKNIEG